MEKYNFKDYVSSVQVYGNTRIIEIDILVPKNFPYQTIAEIDAIRNEIDQEIEGIQRKNGLPFLSQALENGWQRLFARRR